MSEKKLIKKAAGNPRRFLLLVLQTYSCLLYTSRTRLRRPELYEQWCESHPITELPEWKRGENVRLVKTEEQFAAAAKLFAEGRRAVCALSLIHI